MKLHDLRILQREPHGAVEPPRAHHRIEADGSREVVRLARLVDIDMDGVEANAVVLADGAGNIL